MVHVCLLLLWKDEARTEIGLNVSLVHKVFYAMDVGLSETDPQHASKCAKNASRSACRSVSASRPMLRRKIRSEPCQRRAVRCMAMDMGATRLRVPPHDAPIANVLKQSKA